MRNGDIFVFGWIVLSMAVLSLFGLNVVNTHPGILTLIIIGPPVLMIIPTFFLPKYNSFLKMK